jgi:hypothetical protein
MNVTEAAAFCLKLESTLISVDTPIKWELMLQLAKGNFSRLKFLFNSHIVKFPVVKSSKVWTSGSNEADDCDAKRNFTWCSLNNSLSNTDFLSSSMSHWHKQEENYSSADWCIAFQFNKTAEDGKPGFTLQTCDTKSPFICEVLAVK